MKPDITVLMPVYNAGPHLMEAIESILGQAYENFELLIIDDASKDDSWKTISSFTDPRIRAERNPKNLGLIGTLNKGLELARGNLIARMDQDDIALPERLQIQKKYLESQPHIVGVGTALTLLNGKGKEVGFSPVFTDPVQLKRALTVVNPFAHPSMMFRQEAAREVKGYSEEAYAAEDYDFWTRLSEVGPLSNIAEPLLRYRLNPGGMSLSLRTAQKQRTEQIAQREWNKYGEAGPAPLEDWSAIWPSDRSGLSVEELVQHSSLHLLFAKGYRKRGRWWLALRHLIASWQWSKRNRGSYLAILMFAFPYPLYESLEERITTSFSNARAGK